MSCFHFSAAILRPEFSNQHPPNEWLWTRPARRCAHFGLPFRSAAGSPVYSFCLCESICGTAAVPLAFAPPPTTGLRLAHVETPADKCFWVEKMPGKCTCMHAFVWLPSSTQLRYISFSGRCFHHMCKMKTVPMSMAGRYYGIGVKVRGCYCCWCR